MNLWVTYWPTNLYIFFHLLLKMMYWLAFHIDHFFVSQFWNKTLAGYWLFVSFSFSFSLFISWSSKRHTRQSFKTLASTFAMSCSISWLDNTHWCLPTIYVFICFIFCWLKFIFLNLKCFWFKMLLLSLSWHTNMT